MVIAAAEKKGEGLFIQPGKMGSRAYPTEDFGMASWAGLVSEARAYDTDALPAAFHDERVKKSTRRGWFVAILCTSKQIRQFGYKIQQLRWPSWSKAAD